MAGQGNIVWSGGYALRLCLWSLMGGALAGACSVAAPVWYGMLRERILRSRGGLARGEEISRGGSPHCGSSILGGGNVLCGSLKAWQFWAVCFALIFLCWLPCYPAYYPGICAYDVTMQTGQIEDHAYNDHHPILHTLLIEGSMRMGTALFGDANTGLGIMVLAQMCCLAAALAWGITLLRGRGASGIVIGCLQLGSMLYPFHWYMSVSVIKDVFFSIFFLLQMIALCETIRRRKSSPDLYDGLFAISSIGMQLFRTNGRYALLALLVLLLGACVFGRANRRLWGRLVLNCAVCLVAGSLLLSGLFRVTKAEQGDRREMLSMPIQQLARCMLYHGGSGALPGDDGSMEEQDRALINDFILDEAWREYRPDISDPVKRHTNTYVARYRAGDFARAYLHLLCQYPGDFLNAALAVNAGYLYVGDETHAVINKNGRDRGLGYVQTRWVEEELNPRGLYKDSKWESLHEILEEWADENAYLKMPVLKYLFVPGVFLWLYLLLAGCLAARRRYAECMPLGLVMGYYLTLFLGPTVQLRYIYPLMLALPFTAWLTLTGDRDKERDHERKA
ncbi:MAG: DUF6020 family protein [Clostridium sp.]|nr:DUF6020 family protein [Acetatifactor muris]MCM1525881.1 DUF6020 family protein [Bacteroides sp.]MCM1562579.1 DUF6020 family protein [Clostridium sp.]